VLAALSHETFKKFQTAAKGFLKSPGKKWFEEQKVNIADLKEEAKRRKAEFLTVKLKTNKQAGDIAGTKLKKFAVFLEKEFGKYFNVAKMEFEYDEKQSADAYYILKSKGEIIRMGPPVRMKKNAAEFKKRNKNTFVKNGILHSKVKVSFSAKEFMKKWQNDNRKKIKEMDIITIQVY
jgi:tRNA nucleotidyltransferase (CCA-adding enzyme)